MSMAFEAPVKHQNYLDPAILLLLLLMMMLRAASERYVSSYPASLEAAVDIMEIYTVAAPRLAAKQSVAGVVGSTLPLFLGGCLV